MFRKIQRKNFRRGKENLINGLFKNLAILTLAYTVSLTPVYSQEIIPDGNTQTILNSVSNTTNISTNTIKGANAFNSFSKFNVSEGKIVNLNVPTSCDNLINLIHNEKTNINGILNSVKDGNISGNVFLVNPHGVTIGSQGVINVGSLTAVTPTTDYMNSFFSSPGNPSNIAVTQLLDGTAPVNINAEIKNDGVINAINSVKLDTGTLTNNGDIYSGTSFDEINIDLGDVVNLNTLENADNIVVHNSGVSIKAATNITNTGRIVSDGGTNSDAGNITITAGHDINLEENSLISAKGKGFNSNAGNVYIYASHDAYFKNNAIIDARGGNISGSGGFIELSATNTVDIQGGIFKANAVIGTPGQVLVDPLYIYIGTALSDGVDINLAAADSIYVQPGAVVSSRNLITPTTGENVSRIDHLEELSYGNSGNISFNAPIVQIENGAQILSFATPGYTSGNITVTASSDFTLKLALMFGGNIAINTANAILYPDSNINAFSNLAINPTGSLHLMGKINTMGLLTLNGGNVTTNGLEFMPQSVVCGALSSNFMTTNSTLNISSNNTVKVANLDNVYVGGTVFNPNNISLAKIDKVITGNESQKLNPSGITLTGSEVGLFGNTSTGGAISLTSTAGSATMGSFYYSTDSSRIFTSNISAGGSININATGGIAAINKNTNLKSTGGNVSLTSNTDNVYVDVYSILSAAGNFSLTSSGAGMNSSVKDYTNVTAHQNIAMTSNNGMVVIGNFAALSSGLDSNFSAPNNAVDFQYYSITEAGRDININASTVKLEYNSLLSSGSNLLIHPTSYLFADNNCIYANGILTLYGGDIAGAGIYFNPLMLETPVLGSDFLVQNAPLNLNSTLDLYLGNTDHIFIGNKPLNPTSISLNSASSASIVGDISTTGNINVVSTGNNKSASIKANSTVSAGGNLSINTTGDFALASISDNVNVFVGGNVLISSTGMENINSIYYNSKVYANGTISLLGYEADVYSGAIIDASNVIINPTSILTFDAGSINAHNLLTLNSGDVNNNGITFIPASGTIIAGSLSSNFLTQNGAINLTSTGTGPIHIGNLDYIQIGGQNLNPSNITINSGGIAQLSGHTTATGNISITSTAQDAYIAMESIISAGGSISLNASAAGRRAYAGSYSNITAGTDISFSANGNAYTSSYSVLNATGNINLSSTNSSAYLSSYSNLTSGGNTTLSAPLSSATLNSYSQITSTGTTNLLGSDVYIYDYSQINSTGNVTINPTSKLNYYSGRLTSGGLLTLNTGNLANNGVYFKPQYETLQANTFSSDFLNHNGPININSTSNVTLGYLDNITINSNPFNPTSIAISSNGSAYISGKITTPGDFSISVSGGTGTASVESGAIFNAGGLFSLINANNSGQTIVQNGASITSGGNLNLTATNFFGDVYIYDGAVLNVGGNASLSANEYVYLYSNAQILATGDTNILGDYINFNSNCDVRGANITINPDEKLNMSGGKLTATNLLTIDGGDITINGLVFVPDSINTLNIAGGLITPGTAFNYNSASAINAGNFENILINGSPYTPTSISINASGGATLSGEVNTTGNVFLYSINNNANIASNSNITALTGDITIMSDNGQARIDSGAIVNASDYVSIFSNYSYAFVNNNANVTAGTYINVNGSSGSYILNGAQLNATTDISVNGMYIYTYQDALFQAGDDISITPGSYLNFALSSINSGNLLTINSGDINYNGLYFVPSPTTITAGALTSDFLVMATDLNLSSSNSGIVIGNLDAITIGGASLNLTNINLSGYGTMSIMGNVSTSGILSLTSTNGAVSIASNSNVSAGSDINITLPAGNTSYAYIGDNSTVNSGGNITINTDGYAYIGTSSNVTATGSLNIYGNTDLQIKSGATTTSSSVSLTGNVVKLYNGSSMTTTGAMTINPTQSLYLKENTLSSGGLLTLNGGDFSTYGMTFNPTSITASSMTSNFMQQNRGLYLNSASSLEFGNLNNITIGGSALNPLYISLYGSGTVMLGGAVSTPGDINLYSVSNTSSIIANSTIAAGRDVTLYSPASSAYIGNSSIVTAGRDINLLSIGGSSYTDSYTNITSSRDTNLTSYKGSVFLGSYSNTTATGGNINLEAHGTSGSATLYDYSMATASNSINLYSEWRNTLLGYHSTATAPNVSMKAPWGTASLDSFSTINASNNVNLNAYSVEISSGSSITGSNVTINPEKNLSIYGGSIIASTLLSLYSGNYGFYGLSFEPTSITAGSLHSDFLTQNSPINLKSYGSIYLGNTDLITIGGTSLNPTNISLYNKRSGYLRLSGMVSTPGNILLESINGSVTTGSIITSGGYLSLASRWGDTTINWGSQLTAGDVLSLVGRSINLYSGSYLKSNGNMYFSRRGTTGILTVYNEGTIEVGSSSLPLTIGVYDVLNYNLGQITLSGSSFNALANNYRTRIDLPLNPATYPNLLASSLHIRFDAVAPFPPQPPVPPEPPAPPTPPAPEPSNEGLTPEQEKQVIIISEAINADAIKVYENLELFNLIDEYTFIGSDGYLYTVLIIEDETGTLNLAGLIDEDGDLLLDNLDITLLFNFCSGSNCNSDVDDSLGSYAVDVLLQGYPYENEFAADGNGLVYSYGSGYHPRGLESFLKKIKYLEDKFSNLSNEEKSNNSLFSYKHPPAEERLGNVILIIKNKNMTTSKTKVNKRIYTNNTNNLD